MHICTVRCTTHCPCFILIKVEDDNGDDDATASRVSQWKVVIMPLLLLLLLLLLLFNHCKEMKRLQEVDNSKDVFEEPGFVII